MDRIGLGGWCRKRRMTVEELPCLTLHCLKSDYFTDDGKFAYVHKKISHERGFVTLREKNGSLHETVLLEYTVQPFGSYRVWFQCPACLRRCTKLYFYRDMLKCRCCYGLTYKSCQLSDFMRHKQQAEKIHARLERSTEYALFFMPTMPKGMHIKTYRHLAARLLIYQNKYFSKIRTLSNSIHERIVASIEQ